MFGLKPGARSVKIKDIAVFCRQFSVLLNAGIPIVEAVSILKNQSEKRYLCEILTDIHSKLQMGNMLSQALSEYSNVFEDFLINMVKVGEASGSLDAIMERLAEYYERNNKLSQKIKSAMTYPAILAVLTIAVVILLMVEVLPMFTGILSQMGGSMPGITRLLINASDFFVNNLFIIVIAVLGIVVGIRYFVRTGVGKYWFDGIKLAIPGVSVITVKIITARFARSMSILLKSGIPIVNAIDIIKDLIGNTVVEKKFTAASEDIRSGKGISGPIRDLNFFPKLLEHMVAVGENSGELDEMLGRTAYFFDSEVEEAIDRLTVMIEPILIIILGIVVGIIIISIMLPMINVMRAF
ncbi:MAG: type II secretion system F family protein [Oscillospiraceae bacterium]|nr:type II secretion system F family protein [Oscillospiraceae bacterium]